MLKNLSLAFLCLLFVSLVNSTESQAAFWSKKCCNPEPVCCDPCDPCCGKTPTVETEKVEKVDTTPEVVAEETQEDYGTAIEEDTTEVEVSEEVVIPQDRGIVTEVETVETVQTIERSTEYYPGLF